MATSGGGGAPAALALWMQQQAAGAGALSPGYHYDMLHDKPRNAAYAAAIAEAVQAVEDAIVLDIGCGSSLLSLMAARAGAQHVYACEGDPVLARAAQRIVDRNSRQSELDLTERSLARAGDGEAGSTSGPAVDAFAAAEPLPVTVLAKHSSHVVVGYGDDMVCPADIVVSEIVDSALLGEAMLPSLVDARRRGLCRPDALMVPAKGRIWAALVQSSHLLAHEQMQPQKTDRKSSDPEPATSPAPEGSAEAVVSPAPTPTAATTEPFQVHAEPLLADGRIRLLSKPVEALQWDFAAPDLALRGTRRVPLEIVAAGTADAVLLWWDLDLRGDGQHIVSTAPRFLSSDDAPPELPLPARDHWRQAAAVWAGPDTRRPAVRAGQAATLVAAYDSDISFYALEVELDPVSDRALALAPPQDGHLFPCCTRQRALLLNSPALALALGTAALHLQQKFPIDAQSPATLLLVGDGPALHRAFAGASNSIHLLFSSEAAADAARPHLAARPGQVAVHTSLASASLPPVDAVAAVIAEPFFAALDVQSPALWELDHWLRFCSLLGPLGAALGRLPASIEPRCCRVMCQLFEAPTLWQRRQPLDTVEGFDLRDFNIAAARPTEATGSVLVALDLGPWAHSLHGGALSEPTVVAQLDVGECAAALEQAADLPSPPVLKSSAQVAATREGTCHLAVFWVEHDFAGVACYTTGIGAQGHRQAVWAVPQPHAVVPSTTLEVSLSIASPPPLADLDPAVAVVAALRGATTKWSLQWS